MNTKLSVRKAAGRRHHQAVLNGQKGALLIGLILTMVILSVLSSGIVYIFSSANLNPLSGNFSERAYHNAQAGFNYVTKLHRSGNNAGFAAFICNTPPSCSASAIALPGGGDFLVSITTPTAAATYTATADASNNLDISSSDILPQKGFFTKDDTLYRYTESSTTKDVNGTIIKTTLKQIFPSGITGGSITTKPQTTITSIGSFGGVKRKVMYAWPLSGAQSITRVDTMEDGIRFLAPSRGSMDFLDVGGNKAMRVLGTASMGITGAPNLYQFLIGFNWSGAGFDFSANRDYYAQVKVKVNDPISAMPALLFRLKAGGEKTYGLSIYEKSTGFDGIGTYFYCTQTSCKTPTRQLVLWEKRSSSVVTDIRWLAWKDISPASNDYYTYNNTTILHDPMDTNPPTAGGTWTKTGTWSIVTGATYAFDNVPTSKTLKTTTSATLVSPAINLSGYQSAAVSFWANWPSNAIPTVSISVDNGSNWGAAVPVSSGAMVTSASIQKITVDLTPYCGNSQVKIKWSFKGTSPKPCYIDEVNVKADTNWTTLLVRVQEKLISDLPADSCSGGAWPATTATKVNDIRVYLGDQTAHGSASSDPLDKQRLSNTRGGPANWPLDKPDDTTAASDFFTLVKWDGVAVDATTGALPSNVRAVCETINGSNEYTIIRSDSITTPNSGYTYDAYPEVGLATQGWGAAGIFFDDFAVKAEGGSAFIPPIQY